jgi:hypothetical protein
MSTLLQRASVLAAALACIGGPVTAQADGNSAFLDTVREFADPAYSQTDAGLLIYPTDPADPVPSAAAQPEIVYVPVAEPVYVPYAEPVYVTNHVRTAPYSSNAWVRSHTRQTGNAVAPKPETPHQPETLRNGRG